MGTMDELSIISDKLDKARAILDAFSESEMIIKHDLTGTDTTALKLLHKKNCDLFYAAEEYIIEAADIVGSLIEEEVEA